MSDLAIRVNNVSKAFLIGLRESRKETLGAALFSWLRAPLRNYNTLKRLNTFDHNKESEDLFWALKDISFELKTGDTLGIIGDNGAGKSTLLKIISRVMNPTLGDAEVFGRASSLLEVGTGFNSELTGRENVYLNGTILGMTKKEIDKKFDQIVDFSGIEKFIDTQVKKYSTGMRIRLAFSVACNIETEIMIIDEVLSVGDAEFRRKSLAKMKEIAKSGTAIILVSHNMIPIQHLCKRAILMDKGRIVDEGNPDDVISAYLGPITKDKTSQVWDLKDAPSSELVKLVKVEVRPVDDSISLIRPKDPFEFEFTFYILSDKEIDVDVTFHLEDENEILVFIGSTALTNKNYTAGKGYLRTCCRVPENLMNSGKFSVSKLFVISENTKVLYEHDEVLTFEITTSVLDKNGGIGKIDGIVKPRLQWEVNSNQLS